MLPATPTATALLLVAALALPVGAQESVLATAVIEQAFRVRNVPGLTAADLGELIRAGEPSWVTVDTPGTTLDGLLASTCGSQGGVVGELLASAMLELNGGETLERTVEPGTAVAVPFCLEVQRVKVREGDTVEALLRRHYRAHGPKSVRQTFELNRSGRQQSLVAFTRGLQPGDELVLPADGERLFIPRRSGWALPTAAESVGPISGVVGGLEEALVPLEAPTAPATPPPVLPHEYRYVRFVSAADAGNQPACEPHSAPLTFAPTQVRARLAAELPLAALSKTTRPAVVGIVDTGLAGLDGPFFARPLFAANEKELRPPGRQGHDDDDNSYVDDVYGINMNLAPDNGTIDPYGADPDREHGTKIASLALGGPEWVRGLALDVAPRVQLKIVNFSDATRPGPVSSGELARAIGYLANRAKVDVVNLSLASGQPVEGATSAIKESSQALFVVAAGNEPRGLDLAVHGAYPAAQGGRVGRLGDRIVTVGAHDNAGARAAFSNFSAEYVDLLAPGCAIPTIDTAGNEVKEWGTSAATAIVTFVAGLIRSLGEDDAAAIKSRLLASVDVDAELHAAAWSSGRLNAVKAISLRHDVVELTPPVTGYRFGWLDRREELPKFCADPRERPRLVNLLKVRPNLARGGKLYVEFWGRRNDGALWRVECEQANADDSIGPFVVDGLETTGPRLSHVRDIVLATHPRLAAPAPQ